MTPLVPVPASVSPRPGDDCVFTPASAITTAGGSERGTGVEGVAGYLAELLRRATKYPWPIGKDPDGAAPGIELRLDAADPELGDEGYTLDVTAGGVRLRAATAAGLFRGGQTLRQLLPVAIEAGPVDSRDPWTVPGGRIVDRPRYAYRGVMLDVARHFVPVAEVKRLIDLAALHKVNHLHLHLTDDQGWRLEIRSWPRLARYGGGTEVGDGPGGHYTQAEYREIVEYAGERFVTVVPEIDLPGHTNAALASYPELTADGVAPPRYTGIEVGFSSLCAGHEVTYRFLDDVFGEVAALTPGPYLHLGGDEALTTGPDEYAAIVERAQEIVTRHGKTPIGWQDIAAAKLGAATVVQLWDPHRGTAELVAAAAAGTRVILSPADRAYLDMKYDAQSRLGLDWAGHVPVAGAYDWDPDAYLSDVDPSAVLGLESPLWTETVRDPADLDYLAFPRLAALAELGWSPAATHDWASFRIRLAALAPRWKALGVGFFRSPEVPWA